MKKKLICILILVLIFIICITISVYGYLSKEKKENLRHINEDYEKINVYMVTNNQVVGVNAYVEELSDDIISQKFDCLVNKNCIYNKEYKTYIDVNTKLLNSEVKDDVLELTFSKEFSNSSGRKALEQLVWSYCDDQISELKIKVEDEYINNLSGYVFNKLDKTMGINITLESNYWFESNYTTIVNYYDDYVLPVTYFYTDENPYEYIVTKLLPNLEMVNYEVNEDKFNLYFASGELNNLEKQSFIETCKVNFLFDEINIMSSEEIVLEYKAS